MEDAIKKEVEASLHKLRMAAQKIQEPLVSQQVCKAIAKIEAAFERLEVCPKCATVPWRLRRG